jgi:hypothetical protein
MDVHRITVGRQHARRSAFPIRFQRRNGRKRIVAPDGSAIVPVTRPRPEGTLAKALARAHRHGRTGLRASIG